METTGISGFDVAVIGGGAAGHAAAITAARQGGGRLRVAIVERAPRVGRKLLATGNGRCNLSNRNADGRHYHGTDPGFASHALGLYPPAAVMDFFDEIGVPCRSEPDGRIYPYGSQASAVQDALRLEAERCGIETLCDRDIVSIRKRDPIVLENTPLYDDRPFELATAEGTLLKSRTVILATGGPAAPQLGGTDSGYALLKPFGHDSCRPLPAIVQIMTDKTLVKSLSGIRLEGVATLRRGGREVRSEAGEILFTDYGLSGPPILQLGGWVSRALAETAGGDHDLEISLDFFPDSDRAELVEGLIRRSVRLSGVTGADFLSGMLNKRVGQMLVKTALGRSPAEGIPPLDLKDARTLAAAIKDTRIRVTGVQGWREAQVTAGGALTSGFDPKTMASRLATGLYACGEVLDIDGDCGGYNLHWAWCSGFLAGASAAAAAGRSGYGT